MYSRTGKTRTVLEFLGLTCVYYLAGKFGLTLASVHVSATAVWPPSGIALAALLILGYRMWPAIFLGAFLVNITTQGSLPVVIGIASGNTLEAVAGAYLVNRFAHGRHAFNKPHDVIAFLPLISVAAALSATVGVTSLALGGFAAWHNFAAIWLTWWTGDVVGLLVVGSLLVLLEEPVMFVWNTAKVLEAVLLILLQISVSVLIFSPILFGPNKHYPLQFLNIPLLIWAAIGFAERGAALAILLLSSVAIWGTLQGYGPFVVGSTNTALLILQAFMAVTTVTIMTLAAALSERRKAAELLEKAKADLQQNLYKTDELFRLLIENVQDCAIYLVDPVGTVMTWNQGAAHIKGYTAEEIIGRNFSIFYTKEDQASGKPADLLKIAETVGHVEDEGWRVRKDGSRFWANIVISAVRGQDAKLIGFAKVTRDMTARREAELSRSAFVSAASHQLRTPLSAIRWNLELLHDDKKLTDMQRAQLTKEAITEARSMSEIIQILLTLSIIDEGKMPLHHETLEVTTVLSDLEKIHAHMVKEKKLQITLSCPPDMRIVADAQILKEILSNLFSNAIQYTPDRGHITIRVETEGAAVKFSVIDTGIGVPENERDYIFERFYRASNARAFVTGEGTGLGLYLAKMLVRHCGGMIGFESTKDSGSTFWFTIPSSPSGK